MYINTIDDKVSCPICNKIFTQINNVHLKFHNISFNEFRLLYPNHALFSEKMRKSYGNQSDEGKNRQNDAKAKKRLLRIENYNQNPNYCIHCKQVLNYDKKSVKFCSRKCSATFYGIGKIIPKETREKMSNSLKLYHKMHPKVKTDKKIKLHNLICVSCNNSFTHKKIIKNCSTICKSKWSSINNYKQNKTFGKCGYYNNIWCASSWELAFLIYKTITGHNVIRCNKNFTYLHPDGSFKKYFPDFQINDIIYEIKGHITPEVPNKLDSVRNDGFQIELITRKDILPMIKFVKNYYNIKNIIDLYDNNKMGDSTGHDPVTLDSQSNMFPITLTIP